MAALMLRVESRSWSAGELLSRLRLKRPTLRDLGSASAAMALATIGCAVPLLFGIAPTPGFLDVRPLTPDSYDVLLWWLPLFAANILGEELLWRGVMLPKTEAAYGREAWLVNGSGWLLFHICFGVKMLLVLAPLVYATAWARQRTRSTTVGIITHGTINGGGFLALALGAP